MSARIVIVGGGPAGYEAALVAAEHGADVTVVADEGLGGNSVLWDSVPSKALAVAAEARDWMGIARDLGVLPASASPPDAVELPAVTSRALALGAAQSEDVEERVAREGVRVLRGRGRLRRDAHVEVVPSGADPRAVGERAIPADHVLVATGSRARTLPFAPPDGERILTGQDLYRLDRLPERLVVVGSGATGAELAHAMVRLGSDVTLVSSRDRILPSEDPDASDVIAAVFERDGIDIRRSARAVSCDRTSDGVVVGLADGGQVEGTHLLVTVGQVPATEGLGLEDVGVAVGPDGAVPVDAVGRTTVPWVYAAGDVTGRAMLASVAAMQGRVAMWHALGRAVQPIRWDAVPATVFTEPEVASVGHDEAEARRRGIPTVAARLDFRGNPRAKMIGRTDGFVRIVAMAGSGTVLGGVIVAARASELVQPLALAVAHRLTVEQVARTLTVYPSMAGSVAECARMLMERMDEGLG